MDVTSAPDPDWLRTAAQAAALAAGVLLLVAGHRLLPLISAACGALAGWVIARAVSATLVPEWSLLVAGLVGVTCGALVGAAMLRLVLAASAGLAGALLASVAALMLVESGTVDLSAHAGATAGADAQLPLAAASALRAAGSQLLRQLLSGEIPLGDAWARASSAWAATDQTLRTFLLASSLGAGGVCLAAALLFHRQASAALSAALGAALTLAAALPLLETAGGAAIPLPKRIGAWLLIGAALAIGGWSIQSMAMRKAGEARPQAQ